jgi:hypothetical protein
LHTGLGGEVAHANEALLTTVRDVVYARSEGG